MAVLNCGGCRGIGAHQRWCVGAVGYFASIRGKQADRAEALADSIGANNVHAANLMYQAAALLLADAERYKADHLERVANSVHKD